MKTTIELPDGVLEEAHALATSRSVPVQEILEVAVRRYLEDQRPIPSGRFTLRAVTVDGEGLDPALVDQGWSAVRTLVYQGHGD